jgi:hypothetical protein
MSRLKAMERFFVFALGPQRFGAKNVPDELSVAQLGDGSQFFQSLIRHFQIQVTFCSVKASCPSFAWIENHQWPSEIVQRNGATKFYAEITALEA